MIIWISVHELYLFLDVAKRTQISEAVSEDLIKKWLKYASDRDGGRKRRAEKSEIIFLFFNAKNGIVVVLFFHHIIMSFTVVITLWYI